MKCFWSHLTKSVTQSSDIDAVLSPVTGALQCSTDAIITEVEQHLLKVFSGSLSPIVDMPIPDDHC